MMRQNIQASYFGAVTFRMEAHASKFYIWKPWIP